MGPGAHARPRGDPRGAQDEENTPRSSNRDGASRRSEDRGPRLVLARGGRDSSPGVVQSAVNRRQCRHGPRGEARSRRLREEVADERRVLCEPQQGPRSEAGPRHRRRRRPRQTPAQQTAGNPWSWSGDGGMGARVVVTEVDPVKAIEASMDGFEVLPMRSAVREADFIVSATGCKDIVTAAHFPAMKDGVVLANAGHFDNEISKADLQKAAKATRRVREFVDEYTLTGGKRAYLVAEGRLVNIAAGPSHPGAITGQRFAVQAGSAGYLAQNAKRLQPRGYPLPPALDMKGARVKLRRMGVRIDHFTKTQPAYPKSLP